MSIEPLIISDKFEDKKVNENLERWKEILNTIVTAYNSGATKTFNTSASYDVTVANGIITGIS